MLTPMINRYHAPQGLVDQTGDQTAKLEVVGGGTYGRLMSRGSIWCFDAGYAKHDAPAK